MANFIVFIVLITILVIATSIAIAIYIVGEKGLSLKNCIIFAFIPLLGHVWLALLPANDRKVVDEMYARNLLKYDEYGKTIELVVKRETQEINLKKHK